MTGADRSQLDPVEVAGSRRYSQETLLDSEGGLSAGSSSPSLGMTEKSFLSSSSRWESSWALLRSSLDRHVNSRLPSHAHPGRLLKNALIFLIPSFLSPYSNLEFKKYKPNSTEWLDGLRGIAAFFVFISHHVVAYTGGEHDYAWDPKRHGHFLQLPIIRLFYAGSAMVRIFFPARLMRKPGAQGTLMKTLASSVFRRYLRLFLPCFGAFFMIHCWRAWGAFDWFEVRHLADEHILPGAIEKYPPKSPDGFFGQMGLMFTEFFTFCIRNPILHEKYDFTTNKHMWTIPTEYAQSMNLFLFMAGVSHLNRKFRVYVVTPACYLFWVYYQRFDYPLFLSGYFLAELHAGVDTPSPLPVSQPAEPEDETSPAARSRYFLKTLKVIIWSFLAFMGLFLLSFPTRDGYATFGYINLCKMMPNSSYYIKRVGFQAFGASLLCLSVLHLPRVQYYLSMPVFQYLGRISFSLYLVHGAVIRTLGHRLVLEGWSNYPPDAYGGRMVVTVMVWLFAILPAVIWLSDVFWRLIESPCTNFVRWTESLVVAKEGPVVNNAAVKIQ
ncbi:hypothetical protein ABW21_db0201145 [Orbilia brochopaga]|nr:hypothetical protein ABW21_db0201145 [Drechslerella brochopaga]